MIDWVKYDVMVASDRDTLGRFSAGIILLDLVAFIKV